MFWFQDPHFSVKRASSPQCSPLHINTVMLLVYLIDMMPSVYLSVTCQNTACLMFKQKSALERRSGSQSSLEICCRFILKLSKVMNKEPGCKKYLYLGHLNSRNDAQSWSADVYIFFICAKCQPLPFFGFIQIECVALVMFTEGPAIPNSPSSSSSSCLSSFLKGHHRCFFFKWKGLWKPPEELFQNN